MWKIVAPLVVAALFQTTPSSAQPANRGLSGPSPAAPAAVRAMSLVHVDAPQKVNLEVSNGNGDWERLCVSPCDRAVSSEGAYRITGDGIRDSKTFHLDPAGPTTLAVEPTSSGARAGAVVLTVVGSIGLLPIVGVTSLIAAGEIIGAIFICPLAAAFETVKSQQGAEYGNCLGDIATLFAPGYTEAWVWVPALAGAAMLTGGIVGLVATPHTSVRRSMASPAALLPLRQPLAFDAIRLPQPVSLPMVDLHF